MKPHRNVQNPPTGDESKPKTCPVTIEIRDNREAIRKALKEDRKRHTVRVKSTLP
jgi:hypothetical protein